jgi:hypothetical protein
VNQGPAMGKKGYGSPRWTYCADRSGDDEEMEREQMTEVEQFENKSKDEPGDHWHWYRWL